MRTLETLNLVLVNRTDLEEMFARVQAAPAALAPAALAPAARSNETLALKAAKDKEDAQADNALAASKRQAPRPAADLLNNIERDWFKEGGRPSQAPTPSGRKHRSDAGVKRPHLHLGSLTFKLTLRAAHAFIAETSFKVHVGRIYEDGGKGRMVAFAFRFLRASSKERGLALANTLAKQYPTFAVRHNATGAWMFANRADAIANEPAAE
jgi:hypothetical protein